MKMVLSRSGILISLMAWIIVAAAAGESDTPTGDLSAQAIVDRAINRAEAQHNLLADAKFESQVFMSIQSLDDSGQVTNTELTSYHQYPLHGALFEELIAKDGRVLNAQERNTEERNKAKFIREVEKRKKRGMHLQPEKRPGIRFGNQLMRRYRLTMLRSEVVGRHRCWVIAFEPKEGELPVQEMMDHALNQSTGTLWVAQDDYGLVRLDFLMRKPFRYWAGLLAVIRNTEGRLDFQRVEPNIWMPTNFELKLDLNVMVVKNIRRIITKKWADYKRVSSTIYGSGRHDHGQGSGNLKPQPWRS
ncbi:MAG: hypothetical protein H6Q04_3021 [Acidobacteria bacterium]|nr:hypothetical protein [Acidobacteriota bacterium]